MMRRRIVVLTLGAAGLALLLFGAPLAVGLAQFALTEERVALQRLADSTARSLQHQMSHGEVPTVLPDGPGDVTVALYDGQGARLAGPGPAWIGPEVRLGPGGDADVRDGSSLVVASPVSDTHQIVGLVRVAGDPRTVYAALVPWWTGMAVLAGAVLVAVWFLARRQASRLSTPLEELAVDAARLGNGDFSVRPNAAGVEEVDHVVQALDSTARRLDDLLARERAFSAEASHQLRTPLTGLRLQLEAALDGPDVAVRGVIENGLMTLDRLEQTIDDLLMLAREPRRDRDVTDVAALLREAEREWAGPFAALGRPLELRLDPDVGWVVASAAATRQVLTVMLDNARAHGAGRVRVALREIDDSAVAVDVSDEGDGITPEMLVAVARRRTGDGPCSPGHQGMGLALAQRLAAAEGGRLVVNPPATISLLLPVHSEGASTDRGTAAREGLDTPLGVPSPDSPPEGDRSKNGLLTER